MGPFLVSGAVLGAIIGAVLVVLGPASTSAGIGQELILLGLSGALLGGLLGAIVYLLVERFTAG